MTMNSDGAHRYAQLTTTEHRSFYRYRSDNYVYSPSNVNSEITGGRSQITGHFHPEQAKDLVNVLKSGKIGLRLTSYRKISLVRHCQESINAGCILIVVALILLMIYMCMMYGFIRYDCQWCIVLNFFFVLGVLLLPGSIDNVRYCRYGVVTRYGSDANVLIYERTKKNFVPVKV